MNTIFFNNNQVVAKTNKKKVPAKCERRNWSKRSKNQLKSPISGNPSNNWLVRTLVAKQLCLE